VINDRILLIRTGGTIDAAPYDDPSSPPEFVKPLPSSDSLIMASVARLPGHEKVDGFTWGSGPEIFAKNSKLISENDIRALADIIARDDHRYIVITHGTDAMTKNASLLKHMLGTTSKTIVQTGAMVPLSMQDKHASDGLETLGFTFLHIEAQASGVYVAAWHSSDSQLGFFDPDGIEKDRRKSAAHLKFTVKPK